MSKLVVALDVGTTGTRAIAFDAELRPAAQAYVALTQPFPQPGWVPRTLTTDGQCPADRIGRREVGQKSLTCVPPCGNLALDSRIAKRGPVLARTPPQSVNGAPMRVPSCR